MSKECNEKKRCIVKKLNFEDCVATSFKAKGKWVVKHRPKIHREVEDPFSAEGKRNASDLQVKEMPHTHSPVLSQKCGRSRIMRSTPVLAKKRLKMPGSPVFVNKRKQLSGAIVWHDLESVKFDQTPSEPNKTSPVFKFKRPVVKCSPDLYDSRDSRKIPPFDNEESSQSQIESSVSQEQPESFEMKIESFGESSQNESGAEFEISSDKSESQPKNTSQNSTPIELSTPKKNYGEVEKINPDIFDSGKKRKKFKKNSLSARLEHLKKRQASERRIWEHEREIMKTDRNVKETLSVTFFWKESNLVIIKCQRTNEIDQNLILIIDGDVVTDIHKIKENSIICISPPWQKLYLSKLNCTVFLSIVCVEVKEELGPAASHRVVKVAIEGEKTHNSLLTDCLF